MTLFKIGILSSKGCFIKKGTKSVTIPKAKEAKVDREEKKPVDLSAFSRSVKKETGTLSPLNKSGITQRKPAVASSSASKRVLLNL